MRSKLKKALCCAAAAVAAAGIATMAACSYYSTDALSGDYGYDSVVSNGGFAVEAGNYIYFINGLESYSADNTYGDVEKGSIVRISKTDYASGNYSSVETVVPLVTYSGNYDSGIYIYGDYIYYTTPSTDRDSSGEILNTQLEFKSTKLDGTETMKGYYLNCTDSSVEYRYVQAGDGTVYLLYVVSETIFDGVSSTATNIHSINLTTGEDTLLAYDVDEYVFDSSDLESPYVYYTMNVTYNLGTGYDGETTDYSTEADYNQVYKVCAYESDDFKYTAEDKYTSVFEQEIKDADGELIYDYDENPLYVNRGQLIFDGIGAFCDLTQFNYEWDSSSYVPGSTITSTSVDAASLSGYNYSLLGYSDGNLYYTRSYYSSDDTSTPILFYVSDSEIASATSGSGWDAVNQNPAVFNGTDGQAATDLNDLDSHTLILYASSVSGYSIFVNNDSVPESVMYVDTTTAGYAIMWAQFSKGSLTGNFAMANTSSDVTYLTVSEEGDNTFLYYSVSDEGNSYSVHRLALYGTSTDYTRYPKYQDYEGTDEATIALRASESNYIDTKILDLDVSASWFMPEIIEGQLLFASSTDDMVDYNYIMVFDLRADGSADATMSNYDIGQLNELYDDVIAVIDDTDEDNYENLLNALYYVFYTRDDGYLDELVQIWVEEGEDVEYLYSNESQQLYLDFYNATGDYAEYGTSGGYSKTINGEEVYATSRDYFYCLIGYMSEDDAEAYEDAMRESYMQAEPEEVSWWDGLETWVKVVFIVGVSLGGLIIIAAAVLIPILVIHKKHKKLPSYAKAKLKVDTTDDKDIDVYSTDEPAESEGEDTNE